MTSQQEVSVRALEILRREILGVREIRFGFSYSEGGLSYDHCVQIIDKHIGDWLEED